MSNEQGTCDECGSDEDVERVGCDVEKHARWERLTLFFASYFTDPRRRALVEQVHANEGDAEGLSGFVCGALQGMQPADVIDDGGEPDAFRAAFAMGAVAFLECEKAAGEARKAKGAAEAKRDRKRGKRIEQGN